MASRSCSNGRSTTRITDLPSDIIETHLLTKFDGQSLASLASTCRLLHSTICNKESLWKDICNSTWNSIKHPLVQQTISSFPGGYRSFYSQSFPVLRANTTRGSLHVRVRDQVQTSDLISAVDVHYGNNLVYSKVTITNTNASNFSRSLFCVDMIDHEGTHVEMPLRYQGDDKVCMSKLEHNLTLSWIVIDPTSKRAANLSSLRPVSVRPHWDEITSGIKVTYATIISGDCCDTETTEFVECKVVAILGCEKGNNVQLKELSLCLVDMVKMRVKGEDSLRILKEAMESADRRKKNGQGKEIYAKHLNFTRERFIFWVSFVIFIISSFYLITITRVFV